MAILIPAKAKCDGVFGECNATCDIVLRVVEREERIYDHSNDRVDVDQTYLSPEEAPIGWQVPAIRADYDNKTRCPECATKFAAMRKGTKRR
jgi:hypothetical protein